MGGAHHLLSSDAHVSSNPLSIIIAYSLYYAETNPLLIFSKPFGGIYNGDAFSRARSLLRVYVFMLYPAISPILSRTLSRPLISYDDLPLDSYHDSAYLYVYIIAA